MKLPNKLTVIVDTREKNPLLFPDTLRWADHRGHSKLFQIVKEDRTLKTGDYTVEDGDGIYEIRELGSSFERKGSPPEICQNVGRQDGPRFQRCLNRLAKVRHPYLLLDFGVKEFRKPAYVQDPDLAMDRLCRALHLRGIQLMWVAAKTAADRRELGAWIVRVAWNNYWEDIHAKKGEQSCQSGKAH